MSRSSSRRRNSARKAPPSKRQPRQNLTATEVREAATEAAYQAAGDELETDLRYNTAERKPAEMPLWKRMALQLLGASVLAAGLFWGANKAMAEEGDTPLPPVIEEVAPQEEKPGWLDKFAASLGRHVNEGFEAKASELDVREAELEEREEALEVRLIRAAEVQSVAAGLVQCSSDALSRLDLEGENAD